MRKIVQIKTIDAVLRVQGTDAIAGKPPGFKARIRSGLVKRASIIKAASVRAE